MPPRKYYFNEKKYKTIRTNLIFNAVIATILENTFRIAD